MKLNRKKLNKIKKYLINKFNYIKIWSSAIWFDNSSNEWVFEFQAIKHIDKKCVFFLLNSKE